MSTKENSVPVSALPEHLRASKVVKQLERDENGDIDVNASLHSLAQSKRDNKNMTKVILGLLSFCVLLLVCNFGTAVAAARLSKDTQVDPVTGFVSVKGGNAIMKTSEALTIEYSNPGSISEEKLAKMESFDMVDGRMSFKTKGFARSDDETVLLVEGGSLTFDEAGLTDASGSALTLLQKEGIFETTEDGGRKLGSLGPPRRGRVWSIM